MPDMMGKEATQNSMTGNSNETVMVPKSICPGMNFKPGDEMILKVKNVQGDMLEMEYAPEPSKEMTPDEMSQPGAEDKLKGMSSDKMRESLPKAERNY